MLWHDSKVWKRASPNISRMIQTIVWLFFNHSLFIFISKGRIKLPFLKPKQTVLHKPLGDGMRFPPTHATVLLTNPLSPARHVYSKICPDLNALAGAFVYHEWTQVWWRVWRKGFSTLPVISCLGLRMMMRMMMMSQHRGMKSINDMSLSLSG